LSAALTALVLPVEASDFVARAIGMLDRAGWIGAHRFLFTVVRVHLLGWPHFLAPAGMPVTMAQATRRRGGSPQNTCMDSKSPPA
jgi:hypothetical protein